MLHSRGILVGRVIILRLRAILKVLINPRTRKGSTLLCSIPTEAIVTLIRHVVFELAFPARRLCNDKPQLGIVYCYVYGSRKLRRWALLPAIDYCSIVPCIPLEALRSLLVYFFVVRNHKSEFPF